MEVISDVHVFHNSSSCQFLHRMFYQVPIVTTCMINPNAGYQFLGDSRLVTLKPCHVFGVKFWFGWIEPPNLFRPNQELTTDTGFQSNNPQTSAIQIESMNTNQIYMASVCSSNLDFFIQKYFHWNMFNLLSILSDDDYLNLPFQTPQSIFGFNHCTLKCVSLYQWFK